MPKSKKNIKVRDLKPSKDAKGGGFRPQGGSKNQGTGHAGTGTGHAGTGTGHAGTGGSKDFGSSMG